MVPNMSYINRKHLVNTAGCLLSAARMAGRSALCREASQPGNENRGEDGSSLQELELKGILSYSISIVVAHGLIAHEQRKGVV